MCETERKVRMRNAGETYFTETQRFRQFWIWIPILVIAVLCWYGFIHQVILGKPMGSRPAPNSFLTIAWIVFGIGFPLIFRAICLKTEVRDDHVLLNFTGYKKLVPFSEIESAELREYKPIREYGGWGIRYGFKNGWAYNVSGNRGVQLVLKDGKKILIGSQKPEELFSAIESRRGRDGK